LTKPPAAIRGSVNARSDLCCEHCGAKLGPRERHYHDIRAEGGQLDDYTTVAESDLTLLCRRCHCYAHGHSLVWPKQGGNPLPRSEPPPLPDIMRRRLGLES